MSHCRSYWAIATLPAIPKKRREEHRMSRSPIPIVFAVAASALVAVPAGSAKTGDRSIRIHGVCTQQTTSTLKLRREDRGIEVEFEIDQNRNGVPWTVTLSRNGRTVTSFTATTRAPSGSVEIRRILAGRLGTARITARATRASGETCTAAGSTAKAGPAAANGAADDHGRDPGDDHGRHGRGHS
jgi:hypothetical protein